MEGQSRDSNDAKGTVTSLSSFFPEEEARKASQRMQLKIIEKQNQLQNLHHFVADNANLINLVQRLPDQLHHHIMVPFGKAAFFPGRLVRTNELMVLLGEGYYAERTAKQTVDILKRRGKILDSQVDSLNAVIDDFRAKASFFDKTAAEAAEGLVEIREEYMDEDFAGNVSKSGVEKSDAPSISKVNSGAVAADDAEYARIMSRFDELEREELEAEDTDEPEDEENDDNEHEDDRDDDDNEDDEDEEEDEPFSLDHGNSMNELSGREISDVSQPNDADIMKLGNLSSEPVRKAENAYLQPILKPSGHPIPKSKSQSKVSFELPEPDAGSLTSRPVKDSTRLKPDASGQISRPATDSLKAFTGTIIERAGNLPPLPENHTGGQPTSSQRSKPVSRFKMQRR